MNEIQALKDEIAQLRTDQKMLATTIRNTVLALGDVGDDWEGSVDEGIALINANVARVNAEIAEYASSFELYHKASMALMRAYKQAHPEVPNDVWPDTMKVNVWAAAEIERYRELVDTVVVARANDDSAWESPIVVPPTPKIDPRYVASDDPRARLRAYAGSDGSMDMGGWTDLDRAAFEEAVQAESIRGAGARLTRIIIEETGR
jgi:hypothetical protein